MDSVRWDTLAAYFEQVTAMPSSSRKIFLEGIRAKDEVLWNELNSLLAFSENASTFLNEINIPIEVNGQDSETQPPIDPFELIGSTIGRYKVLSVLGGGGMGVVYKAEDTGLGRFVALKFLPPILNRDTNARERFYTEARAASALDHVNVCTVYEIGLTPDEQHIYIAMGFYEGLTLKERIEQGPLPIDETLDYAQQIASGLHAAHQHNIIHRDIKPGNIIITKNGVVKILDFGIAKLSGQHLTETGMTLGTTAYMSPERIRGVEPDPSTDIWSFGVLLYEMLSGVKPFKGVIPEAIMYSVIHEEPDYQKDLPHDLSPSFKQIIEDCLKKHPDKRYESVDRLLGDLQDERRTLHPAPLPLVDSTSKRPKIALAASLILLLLLSASWFISQRNTTPAPSDDEKRIAILPFTASAEGSAEDQVLAEGMMHMLVDLFQSLDSPEYSINVIPISELQHNQVKTPEDARKMLGVNVVVEGELNRLRDVVALSLNLMDPRDNRHIGDNTLLLDQQQSFSSLNTSFQEELLEQMAEILDAPLLDKTKQAFKDLQPKSPDAYTFYLQGLGYLNSWYKGDQYYQYAIDQFTQALSLDSTFALAHAGLCEALFEKFSVTLDPTYVDEAQESCDRGVELGSDQAPVLAMLGRTYQKRGKLELAKQTLNKAIAIDPTFADSYRWLGFVYNDLTDRDSTIINFQKAIDLKPSYWLHYYELAGILFYFHGRKEESLRQLEIVHKLTPDNHIVISFMGINQFHLGQTDKAIASHNHALKLKPEYSLALKSIGILHYYQGSYQTAIDYLTRSNRSFEDIEAKEYLAKTYQQLGLIAQADSLWHSVIQQASTHLQVNEKFAFYRVFRANAYAELGELQKGIDDLEFLSEEQKTNHFAYIAGRIYERNDDRDTALHYLRRALEDTFTVFLIEHDSWLDDLKKSPDFQTTWMLQSPESTIPPSL